MNKKIISTAAFLGMIAIVLGAFGAHALKKALSMEQLATFETGVKYQMYHALFLLFLGLNTSFSETIKKRIFNLVLFGVILFSGSIYLLSISDLTPFDFKKIGFVTPIGGLFLITAWAIVFVKMIKNKS